jgi:hypothetical protein
VCSSTPSPECAADVPQPAQFQCTADGYIPDPDDCTEFHFCVKGSDTTYLCSTNYVYSHEKRSCVRRRLSSDCAVIKCTYKVLFEYVVYPKDSNVYGLCRRNQTTLMFKCNEGEQFDTKTSKCTFVCKKEGVFPVQGDSQRYRECIYNSSNKLELVERVCPAGSEFDSGKGLCVVV